VIIRTLDSPRLLYGTEVATDEEWVTTKKILSDRLSKLGQELTLPQPSLPRPPRRTPPLKRPTPVRRFAPQAQRVQEAFAFA